MASPLQLPMEDKDLDDAALWAVIDSAAAASTYTYTSTTAISNKSRKPLTLKHSNFQSPFQSPPPVHHKFSPPLHQPQPKLAKTPRFSHGDDGNADIPRENGVVCEEESDLHRPKKMSRSCVSKVCESSPMAVVRHANHRLQVTPVTPVTPVYSSPETERFTVKEVSPFSELTIPRVEGIGGEEKENMRHCLSGRFPTVSLFKEYQNAAMSILEKSDCTMISGNPFIKKSGWRKIAFYFNISFEIKDKNIEFDESHNVQRAEFVVRAYMQGGRFSDGWGSCERREKKFSKPNHDIPSTAETRAKNKACQDLLGIGLYHAGASASHGHTPR